MSKTRKTDAVVTYRLKQPLDRQPGRIFKYKPDWQATKLTPRDGPKVRLCCCDADGPCVVEVRNGTRTAPVRLGIRVLDVDGHALKPLAILTKRVAGKGDKDGRRTFPKAEPSTDGFTLVLTDDDDAKASYKFDVLFSYEGEDGQVFFGWLDPRLHNS